MIGQRGMRTRAHGLAFHVYGAPDMYVVVILSACGADAKRISKREEDF